MVWLCLGWLVLVLCLVWFPLWFPCLSVIVLYVLGVLHYITCYVVLRDSLPWLCHGFTDERELTFLYVIILTTCLVSGLA